MKMENLDHVYCNTNSISNSDNSESLNNYRKEIKQLQSMLMLHLDLIQEQSDQLLSKDKMLLKLKQDNEILRGRLERMDRRILHHKQPKEKEINLNVGNNVEYYNKPTPIYSNANENGQKHATINKIVLQRIQGADRNLMSIKKEVELTEYDNYDFLNDDEDNHQIINENEISKPIKIEAVEHIEEDEEETFEDDDHRGYLEEDEDEDENLRNDFPDETFPILNELCPLDNEEENIEEEESENIANSSQETILEDDNNKTTNGVEEEKQVENRVENEETVPSSNKVEIHFKPAFNSNSNFSSTSTSSGNTSDSKKQFKNNFMVTTNSYITCNWKDDVITADIEKLLENEAAELEIPCWTVVEDNSSNENFEASTENVTDEVYLKRHAKLEVEERRRKKWDVQRIREQKTIERLKKRHLKELYVETNEPKIISSFYPSIDSIKYIQITDEIPVQAFGESIPLLPSNNFHLPWHISSSSNVDKTPEIKTKFLHRLAPTLMNNQKPKFTKRVKKDF